MSCLENCDSYAELVGWLRKLKDLAEAGLTISFATGTEHVEIIDLIRTLGALQDNGKERTIRRKQNYG